MVSVPKSLTIPDPWQRVLVAFGAKLRRLRDEAGLTQVELGRRIGISKSTVSAHERGEGTHVPSEDFVCRYIDGCEFWTDDVVVRAARRAALLHEYQQLALLREMVRQGMPRHSNEIDDEGQVLKLAGESGLVGLPGLGPEVIPIASTTGTTELPTGTYLWRVHPRSVPAGQFAATRSSRCEVMYLWRRDLTALLEELLRAVPFGTNGEERILSSERLDGMVLSVLRTTQILLLANMDEEPDLVGLWPPDGVHGIEWPATRGLPESTIVLLGDRCPPNALSSLVDHSTELDDADNIGWLREILSPYGVRVPDRPDTGS
jgi:transcriptional regulator with XRE-family HTH domain